VVQSQTRKCVKAFDNMYDGMYFHATGAQRRNAPKLGSPRRTQKKARGSKVMARKKISTTIYITPEQNESLKLLHERTKVPIAVYIREGIDLVLERHQSELPGQLTLVAAGGDKKG